MNNKKVIFQLNESIFQLENPTQALHTTDSQCIVCDKELKPSHKHYCQFCGHKACKECAHKLRPFANQDTNVDKTNMSRSELQRVLNMGSVCRICDRKFILRDSYQQYAGMIAYYEKEYEQLEHDQMLTTALYSVPWI